MDAPRLRSAPVDNPTDALLTALAIARGQHGVLTRGQAKGSGLSDSDLRALRRDGTFGHPYEGVYAVRSLFDPSESEGFLRTSVMAAQLALGPRSIAGGETAARLWGMQGLPSWDGRTVHMIVPGPGTKRHRQRVTLHTWEVGPEEVTAADGVIRVTVPGRTLRDVVLHVDRETAVSLIDSALQRGLVREEGLEELALANGQRKGCVRTRPWWDLADGRAESPLESWVRLACADAGLPPTSLQRRFLDGTGRIIAVADLWWEDLQLIGEADGLGPHGLPEVLARDRRRQNALQLSHPGVRIVRFTWQDAMRPGYITAALARAAGREGC
ncbi:PDDEXK family nuclease [Nocardiopsis salina]|uniref:hypothetical protein n=1 Tax=Nocardiopsis salina TaxID=245836 RepID=UPI000348A168|nr:hypothetical protein [Nocardiopsis salina]